MKIILFLYKIKYIYTYTYFIITVLCMLIKYRSVIKYFELCPFEIKDCFACQIEQRGSIPKGEAIAQWIYLVKIIAEKPVVHVHDSHVFSGSHIELENIVSLLMIKIKVSNDFKVTWFTNNIANKIWVYDTLLLKSENWEHYLQYLLI